MDLYKMLEVNA